VREQQKAVGGESEMKGQRLKAGMAGRNSQASEVRMRCVDGGGAEGSGR
jgi:hypothetical protein